MTTGAWRGSGRSTRLFAPTASRTRSWCRVPATSSATESPRRIRANRAQLAASGLWMGANRAQLAASERALDLHRLGLFAAGQGVDLLDLAFGDLLQAGVGPFRVVLGDLARLLHLVDAVDLVAPRVADRDARLLRLLADDLHELAPALLGQRRNRDSDDVAVIRRIEARVTRAQSLLHRPDLALVVDLHDQEARFGRADLGELVERSRRAVVRNHDLVDQGGVGAAGANGLHLGPQKLDRLRQLLFRVPQDGVDHEAAPTRVPISSPSTTRSMLPSVSRLKTTIGTLLSMHSVSAVLSMTSMPLFNTSM